MEKKPLHNPIWTGFLSVYMQDQRVGITILIYDSPLCFSLEIWLGRFYYVKTIVALLTQTAWVIGALQI